MIDRSTDIRAALRRRQGGFLLNPFRFGGGGGGGPIVESVAHTNAIASINSVHGINMPAGIVSGNFLVCVVRSNPITSHTSGWTKINYNVSGDLTLLYKIAAGGDSLTINENSGTGIGATVFRVSGANSVNVGWGWSSGTSAPDTPAVTPVGGHRGYLGISCVATLAGNNGTTATALPTGYGNYARSSAAGVNSAVIHSARYTENTSTVNPSAWTLSASVFFDVVHIGNLAIVISKREDPCPNPRPPPPP